MFQQTAQQMALETTENQNQLRVRFPAGIIGFEDLRHYHLQPLQANKPDSIFWQLTCQDVEDLSFALFFHDNQLGNEFFIKAEDLAEALNPIALPAEELITFLIVANETINNQNILTVNLRAPLVLHLPTKQAWQVILTDPSYPIALPLTSQGI